MKKNGFTLIELMVVIVIIGIITAVVLPAFQNAGKQARSQSNENMFHVETYKGHDYIIRQPGNYSQDASSMTHDPDCACFKKLPERE